jgi:PIN domain nuclease of toxin-antitoxin system
MILAPQVWTPEALPDYDGPLLLDTAIWLWYLTGDRARLGMEAAQLLDRSAQQGQLLVCDISCWELATRAAKGKLTLTVDVGVWLQRAESVPGIRYRALTRPVLVQSTRLPGTVHGDPADRMLMAMALLDGVPLVTTDALMVAYAQQHPGLAVVDVR